jgi:polysaccharide chain length determinant protein (PEP-CTERM system associated)
LSPNPDARNLSRRTWADYLEILSRRRKAVAVTALFVCAVCASFVLGLPPLYRASATILVQGAGRQPSNDVASGGDVNARLQAIKQEALSRARLTDLITRFNLYPNLRRDGSLDAAMDQLQRDIRVENTSTEPVNGQVSTIAFRLTYVGNDAATTANVTNALASFYVAQNDRIRTQQASRSAESLKAQMDETKARLDAQEGRVRAYTAQNMGALPQQADANLASLSRLTEEMRSNSEEQIRLMERRQSLQNQMADLDVKPPADPTTPSARLEAAKKQLNVLLQGATEQNPDVKALKRDIAALTVQVKNDASAPTAPAPSPQGTITANLKETDGQIAKLTEANKALRSSVDSYEQRVESAPARGPEFEMLMRDYQATRDLYDVAQKRYNDAQLAVRAEAVDTGEEFRVLDSAIVPTVSAGPNRLHLLALALVIAIVAGFVAGLVADHVDSSFHSIDDLRAFTRIPVLTSIPPIRTTRDAWSTRGRVGVVTLVAATILVGITVQAFVLGHHSEEIARLLLRMS